MKKKEIKDTKKTKEIKFETKQLKNTTVDHDNSAVVTFIVALIVIAVLVGGLYYVNARFVTKDKYQGDETTTTTKEVSYDPTIIVADDALKQSETEYMVVFYDKSKDDASYISSLISGYKGDSKIYSVELNNKMNSEYYAKDGNVNDVLPTSIEELKKNKVSNPTLIKVKKGKITEIVRDTKSIYTAIDGVKFN